MPREPKISPAFELFLANSGPNDKREAIVIFRASAPAAVAAVAPRGRLRSLKQRLDQVKRQAAAQLPDQERVLAQYQKSGSAQLASRAGLSVATIGQASLPVAAVEVTRKTLPGLASRPEVVAILPNQRIRLIRPKAVSYSALGRQEAKDGLTWGLKRLEIPKAWETSKGAGINVAVLDTGVYADHPALAGRVKDFVVIDPLGRRIKTTPPFDSGQHGTHVCGTIAGGKAADGVAIGVAPEANLFAAGVLVGEATLHTLLEGISWAVEKGADIISMSLGFTYYEPLFAEVCDFLLQQYGILPVVAIGNENHGNTSSPGNAPGAFSVGAVEKVAGGKLDVAAFSSGASLVFPADEKNGMVTKPEVVAPGVQVFSAIPPERSETGLVEYGYMDGTSMATPHVAGVAALLMAAKPAAPVEDIVRVIKETAWHPGGQHLRPDNRWGYGLVQPVKALAAL